MLCPKEPLHHMITSSSHRSRARGFTIVELLVVIVVIAILAAITIVAYGGITQRANNARVISGVESYVKVFGLYKADNSGYPTQTGCLGANYPGGYCWQGDSGAYQTNPALDAVLAQYLPQKPVLVTSLFSIGIGNNMRGGALYHSSDGKLVFYLQGVNQNCSIAGATAVTEGSSVTQCTVQLQ